MSDLVCFVLDRMTMNASFGGEDSPKRVLLVDDEHDLLEILERFLRIEGFEAHCAHDGREGLRLFERGPWDVVVVDRAMPEMNGEQLGAAIKSSSPNVPLIMITGFRNEVAVPEIFDHILTKPFLPSALVECLSQTLQKHSELLFSI